MRIQSIKKGFTLIELLVVITIIGILATGATTVFTSQIQKARDSSRITAANAVRGGIEQFYQDTSTYPSGTTDWLTAGTVDMQDFLPTLAEDPKHNETCNGSRCGYVYTVWPDVVWIHDGAYELSTAFENQGNIDSKAGSGSDNGEDDSRLEIGTIKTTSAGTDFNTVSAQATSFVGAAAVPGTITMVIVKSNVVTK